MPTSRLLLSCLAVAAAAGGPLGCATIMRPDHATVSLLRAPPDLTVTDERGVPVFLADDGAGGKRATVGWKPRVVTMQTRGQSTTVELPTGFSIGYFLVDYLFAIWPILVDWTTGKWTNFNDVDVPVAIAEAQAAGRTGTPVLVSQATPPAQARSAPPPQPSQRGATPVAAASTPAAPPPNRTPVINIGKLAVLDFKSFTDVLKPEDVRYFTDVVRGATLKTAPGLQVMTRENLLVLLQATGKDASQCEGECEVETGRRIGADVVISGEILKVGTRFKMSLKLHETKEGRLLSTSVASGKSIDELDESAQAAASELLIPKQ